MEERVAAGRERRSIEVQSHAKTCGWIGENRSPKTVADYCCPLSPRERARVRGNSACQHSGHRILKMLSRRLALCSNYPS
jgi:hypothetical protein